ncbi:MAG: substrate-binding domain-containing protein [Aeromonas sp.]
MKPSKREAVLTAMAQLLSRGVPFSAVVAFNDAMVVGAVACLQECGLRIPEDVSIIGFDDIPSARYCAPKLTTLRYPIEAVGRAAAERALALLAEKDTQEVSEAPVLKFATELIEPASVAAPPKTGQN